MIFFDNALTLTVTVQNYVPDRRKLSFHTRETKFMHGKTSIIFITQVV